ncbi:hypothetical protein CGLO_12265 [Colletotrichum gloeosporioides Cg-14]|uniref:Uncharacterized protein n=1 Tax=Colletotrichum gloeosporioides (strain Cg-14) TaxID=1237896 RepID=T0LJZ9_COLGC|nr:hypothetical protein CGLO_12265 [Colletotrichum gloeosporioides Cg-14]
MSSGVGKGSKYGYMSPASTPRPLQYVGVGAWKPACVG